jgi:dihydrofolate reductase
MTETGRAKTRTSKTQYYTATSIDGFIADANNSLEWLFQFGADAASVEGSEEVEPSYPAFIAEVGAMAMGSTTYEWIVDHEDLRNQPEKWAYAQPTWVFSSRELPVIAGADVRFVSGEVGPVHDAMIEAAGDRNVWLVGGGDLVGQFHDQGLLDEIIVTMMPVFLGSGAPLLPRTIATPPCELIKVDRGGRVYVELTYAVPRPSRDA